MTIAHPMRNLTVRTKRTIAIMATASLLAFGLVFVGGEAASAEAPLPSPANILQPDANVVSADALPTIQIDNGYVWAQTMIGDTVYAAGSFANARQAGAAPGAGALTTRTNILAYNITTGALTSFAPTVNGVIKGIAASPDGSRIYIGGSFNTVNGQTRYNVAAVDAITGALVPGFAPSVGGTGIYSMVATASTLYVGGLFSQGNATARKNLAAFSTSNGALLGWAPTTDLQVDAMVMDPSNAKVIIGGRFAGVNGVTQRGLAALDLNNGSILPWAAPATVINGASSGDNAGKAGIFSLTADAGGVYGTGWVYADVATGNLEGVFAAEAGTGDIRWVADCHGDNYGVFSTGSVVYTTSHTHQCDTVGLAPELNPRTFRYMQAFTAAPGGILTRSPSVGNIYKDWSGTVSPSPYAWYPDFTVGNTSGLGQAGLSITGNTQYISVGGEFGSVNNRQFSGLVRFGVNPAGGAKMGPRLSGDTWTGGVATSKSAGTARITIPTNWDRDDLQLTYSLYRTGTAAPVATTIADSTWWNTPPVTLKDTGLTPGSSQTYRVTATDGDGNTASSNLIAVTVASGTPSAYGDRVLDDGANLFWRLGDDATDWAGGANPTAGSGVSTTTPGAVVTDASNSASLFNGTGEGVVSTTTTRNVGTSLSVEAWIKTTTTSGGKIVGYGSSKTGDSSSYDRHLYMSNDGRVTFGVYDGNTRTVTSTDALNDGAWHQVVGTMSPSDGLKLYVDGVLASSNPAGTSGQAFSGYWRVGGDNLNGWPNQPSSSSFNGRIDEVSVYGSVLSPASVSQQYGIAQGIASPTAAFTATPTALTVAVDGAASSAPFGRTISSYAWTWGDGTAAGSGATASHSYAAPGTYQQQLTVTDSSGQTGTITKPVTVVAANAPPTAAFSSSAAGLLLSADGGGSTDSDGTVASYSWNWGDGTAAGSGKTPTHSYAVPGTYPVTLTVTDNQGATGTSTASVAVTHTPPVASFTNAVSGLGVSVDASASSASGGATLSYSWNWGDGTATGSGKTASHSYSAGGSYTIVLTVTDSLAATSTKSTGVTIAGASTSVAVDAFGRSVASGWGSADFGGAYSVVSGAASAASVSGGAGALALTPGNSRSMMLTSAKAQDTTTSAVFALDSAPSSGSAYAGVIARQMTGANDNYTTRVWLNANGSVWVVIQRGGTVLQSLQLPGITRAAGDAFNLKVSVTGTSPTTIAAKVWRVGAAEPASAQLTVTDSTAVLQGSGYVGLHGARAGSATTTGTITFDNYAVTNAGSTVPTPNVAPTAAFTSSAADLTASVDASVSADSDGAIAAYSWNWGDGTAAGIGATATHGYAAAGTYQVVLTVTDDGGLTGTVTRAVTVTVPAPTATVAVDAFGRSVASGWGSADFGGAYSVVSGAASAASVSGGAGALALTPGNSRSMMLTSAKAQDTTTSAVFALDSAPSSGSAYAGVIARQMTGANDNYTTRVWLNANGSVWVVIQRGGTVLQSLQLPGITRAAGDAFNLKVSVTGTSPTTIAAKVWRVGAAEPASAQLTVTDSTAVLQGSGYVGLHGARAGSATTTGTITFDNYAVTKLN